MKVLHTVKKSRLAKIKKSGFLKPQTLFFQDAADRNAYEKPSQLFRDAVSLKYTCAIPKSRIVSWLKTGFIDEIKFFIRPDYILEFELPKKSFAFVREHYYTSPKYVQKTFGIHQFYKLPHQKKLKMWKEYLLSSKICTGSKDLNGIKVPELWVNATVPMSRIKITQFSLFLNRLKRKASKQ